MAKKKSIKIQRKPIRQKVATKFDCHFCSFPMSIECKLDKKRMIGNLKCRVCKKSFDTVITELSSPVDIYCDWIDACDEINS